MSRFDTISQQVIEVVQFHFHLVLHFSLVHSGLLISSQGKGDVATNILQPGVVCPALVIPILGRKYSLHRPGITETLTNEGVYLRDHGVTEALTEFTNVTAVTEL